ncbi:hypothetical protein ABZV80_42665 [Streptomyces sp. NPDC005132]|uniref:hypothetical protein n=1 Tax=Streptomyces sp. NPDC005132 TaxID=3154294 RepID=UPI00339DED14
MGLVVAVPGLTAAVTAPVLTIASGKLDLRKVLIALAVSITVSNILAASTASSPTPRACPSRYR